MKKIASHTVTLAPPNNAETQILHTISELINRTIDKTSNGNTASKK